MWNKLKYHGLQGAKKIRGSYLCVPLSFLAEATGAGYESEEDGAVVILKLKRWQKTSVCKRKYWLCD